MQVASSQLPEANSQRETPISCCAPAPEFPYLPAEYSAIRPASPSARNPPQRASYADATHYPARDSTPTFCYSTRAPAPRRRSQSPSRSLPPSPSRSHCCCSDITCVVIGMLPPRRVEYSLSQATTDGSSTNYLPLPPCEPRRGSRTLVRLESSVRPDDSGRPTWLITTVELLTPLAEM